METITVITVCFNAEATIEMTMRSVLNQTYPDVEYIIVDGASTDGTMTVVESVVTKYPDKRIIIKSEPDTGIYNAMNKGIKMATGDWINFMNAGDSFASNEVLESIACRGIPDDADVLYGDSYLHYPWGTVHSAPVQPLKIGMFLPFTHQATFVKSDIMKEYGFDESYSVAGDMDFFMKLSKNGFRFHYLNIIIVLYEMGGFSDNSRLQFFKEYGRISGKTGTVSYILNGLLFFIKSFMKALLPDAVRDCYLKWKYRKSIVINY